jgi:hypothetical protein
MIIKNEEMRKEYLRIFEEIQQDELFTDVNNLLRIYNFSVKIEQDTTYQKMDEGVFNDDIFSDITTLGYLYNNKIYDEVSWRKAINKPSIMLNNKGRAEKLYEVSQKLIFLYRRGHWSKLEKYVFDTQEIIEAQWVKGEEITREEILSAIGIEVPDWSRSNTVYNSLLFSIDGVQLFYLGGNRYFTVDNIESFIEKYNKKEYFYEKVRSQTDLLNITEMDCFPVLSDKCKNHIIAGTQLIDKIFAGQIDDLLDYSPLLMNFGKALEAEIKGYYDKHYAFIGPIAEVILSSEKYIRDKIKSPHISYQMTYLFALCREITRFKENYYPSGYKSFPYFLYYFGLGQEIDKIIEIDGFLDNEDRIKVQKENNLIEKFFGISNNRNKYIHEKMIESKNEFLYYYYDIYLALNLIANIK